MTGLNPDGPDGPPALRALSVGEILDAAFTIYRKHFRELATIVLVCWAVPIALETYVKAAGWSWLDLPEVLAYAFAYALASVVLGAIATGATVFVVSESYLGRTLTAGEAFRRAAPMLSRLVTCSLLLGLVVTIGFFLLVVPGVVLLCGLILAIPALVREPQLTASTALSRSWMLTSENKRRIFALLVTSTILVYIPVAAVEGLAALFLSSNERIGGAASSLVLIVRSVVWMFLSPFLYCVLTVAYYDLRVRKEGFDLELLASSLQPA